MKSLFRAFGAFIYASVVSIGFMILSVLLLMKGITVVHGFWKTALLIIGFIVMFAWLAEKGLELLSLPFNWLWDQTMTTRVATAIPVVLVGLWCMAAPFRLPIEFTTGDWVLTAIWWIGVLFFYVNFILMPFTSPNMGVRNR